MLQAEYKTIYLYHKHLANALEMFSICIYTLFKMLKEERKDYSNANFFLE